ncbi:MAG TPA: AAA family ATPase [Candidatus Melainabacteria bacterium]|nr:AAA family ATPase [Candidatus Melainabacteria bacterium]HMP51875.1 AAA family ATPase [Candidatus Melainabacteria bacterium]
MKEIKTPFYIESVAFRSFRELGDACREQTKIGMSFGSPGVGKTEAALRYSNWTLVESILYVRDGVPIEPGRLLECDTLYYKPGVTVSPPRLRSELSILRNRFHDVKARAVGWLRPSDWAAQQQTKQVYLVIVDEAHRLKYAALEELRDLQERWEVGVILIGDPGMECSLARMFHFADRVRYIEKFEPLSTDDVRKYVDKHIEHAELTTPTDDVYSLIADYCLGNPRILGHLFALVERLLKMNDDLVDIMTTEVIETARQMMLVRGTVAPLSKPVETLTKLANAG